MNDQIFESEWDSGSEKVLAGSWEPLFLFFFLIWFSIVVSEKVLGIISVDSYELQSKVRLLFQR